MKRHHKWAIVGIVIGAVIATPIAVKTSMPKSVPTAAMQTCYMNGQLPDAMCTPGSIDPRVTQSTIKQTICVSGYTKTVRPPQVYTSQLKAHQMAEYGFTDSISAHEEDHLISLELGGNPTDPKNLWPEPGASPNPKDKAENLLHSRVCDGQITLAEAQKEISTDWTQVK